MSRKHTPGKKPYYGDGPSPYSKYRAKRTEIDGITFASKMEGRRYVQLKDMVKRGEIRDLEIQPRFRLEVDGQKICDYVGDYRYFDVAKGEVIVEDVKSPATITPIYRVKRRLMQVLLGITILETQA